MLRATLAMLLATLALLGGCSKSRLDTLRDKSDRIESDMRSEQKRVLSLTPDQPARSARLHHLNQLQFSLRAANVALGAIPWTIPEGPDRDMALDTLDEVYDTIDWNIPLGPDDPKRAFPDRWDGNSLLPAPTR